VVLNPALLKEINDKTLTAMKNSGNDFLMGRAALPGYQPLYGAPLLLLLSAPAEHPYGRDNCAAAVTTAGIAATALGLGSCYVISPILALEPDRDLAAKVGIPDGFRPVCGLIAGYAGPDNFAAPRQEFKNVHYCL
jgi:nitroreductase